MNKKIKKGLIIFVSIMAFISTIGICLFFYIDGKLEMNKGQYSNKLYLKKDIISPIRDNSYSLERDIETLEQIEFEKIDGIENILLLGADFRKNDEDARSDCMMILTIDTVNKKIKITSLMRDVLVKIPNVGDSKLNHAFYLGGVDLLKETIKQNFSIDIDKYMLVDFESFTEIIDILGGIEVNVEDYEINELNKYIDDIKKDDSLHIKESGIQVLNGRQALSYVRIRKNVGDEYGRNERQREVVTELFKKAEETPVFKYPEIINTVVSKMDTNIDLKSMLSLVNTVLKFDLSKVEMSYLPYSEISKGGIYGNHGWVFRTDLERTRHLFNRYIYFDEKPNFN